MFGLFAKRLTLSEAHAVAERIAWLYWRENPTGEDIIMNAEKVFEWGLSIPYRQLMEKKITNDDFKAVMNQAFYWKNLYKNEFDDSDTEAKARTKATISLVGEEGSVQWGDEAFEKSRKLACVLWADQKFLTGIKWAKDPLDKLREK